MTDVTGFGVLGHLLEVCRGSKVGAELDFSSLPVWSEAMPLAQAGFSPGAANRNWNSYGNDVVLPQAMPEWQRKLLCDPQTSGGLMVSCRPEMVERVLALFRAEGFDAAAVIGRLIEGDARVAVV